MALRNPQPQDSHREAARAIDSPNRSQSQFAGHSLRLSSSKARTLPSRPFPLWAGSQELFVGAFPTLSPFLPWSCTAKSESRSRKANLRDFPGKAARHFLQRRYLHTTGAPNSAVEWTLRRLFPLFSFFPTGPPPRPIPPLTAPAANSPLTSKLPSIPAPPPLSALAPGTSPPKFPHHAGSQ